MPGALRRPKGSGLKVDVLPYHRTRLAHLAIHEFDGEFYRITADAEGVTVKRWHAPAPVRRFSWDVLVKNTVGKLLTDKPAGGTVPRPR